MYYLKKKKSDKPKKRQTSQATLVKKLDKVFSQYIRLRDAFPNGTFRCPTCGRILPFAKGDCSHLYSRRHMATRFDEDNCVMECAYDNRFNSEHLIKIKVIKKARTNIGRFIRNSTERTRMNFGYSPTTINSATRCDV